MVNKNGKFEDANSQIKTWLIFAIVTLLVYTGAAAFVYMIVF